jgi:glycosyltransferase involved in cell wall biosynthesis
MRIASIFSSRVPSETANSIQAMKASHALAQLGHEVITITPGGGPQAATGEEKWEILARQYGLKTTFRSIYLPPFDNYFARRIFPWRAVLRGLFEKPDLIYTWMIQSAVMGLFFGLPVVLELHDMPLGKFGRLWYRLFLRLPGRKRQLVITRALVDALAEDYPLAMPETFIAPNGVDLDRYDDLPSSEKARESLGMPDMPIVACTGHLYAGRGVELFLALAQQMPDVHFLWVGGRLGDVERWRVVVEEKNLSNVSFPGFVPNADLPRYQAAADILLMPYQQQVGGSSGEAPVKYFSSMKMYEYMASSRPIISSDLPVIHESLDPSSALYCPPDDVTAWEKAIQDLLSSPEKAARLAANARKQVGAYSWTARAAQALEGWV